jgi:hypothetical protein
MNRRSAKKLEKAGWRGEGCNMVEEKELRERGGSAFAKATADKGVKMGADGEAEMGIGAAAGR